MEEKLIRLSQVEDLIGCKKTKIYEMVKSGDFPRPIALCTGNTRPTRRWALSHVQRWITNQINQQQARHKA